MRLLRCPREYIVSLNSEFQKCYDFYGVLGLKNGVKTKSRI